MRYVRNGRYAYGLEPDQTASKVLKHLPWVDTSITTFGPVYFQ